MAINVRGYMGTSSLNSVTRLLDRWRNGEPNAVGELWARYFDRLRHHARWIFRRSAWGVADDEDAAISAFWKVVRNLNEPQFRYVTCSATLEQALLLATEQKARDLYRRENAKKRAGRFRRGDSVLNDDDAAPVCPRPGPEQQALYRDFLESLRRHLPTDEHREILAHWLKGASTREIAERLGISEKRVYRKLLVVFEVSRQLVPKE